MPHRDKYMDMSALTRYTFVLWVKLRSIELNRYLLEFWLEVVENGIESSEDLWEEHHHSIQVYPQQVTPIEDDVGEH